MNNSNNAKQTDSHTAKSQHIIVGLSGGVDSSVSALLLQQAGHELQALFMKNWEEDDSAGHCSATVDYNDASVICSQLGILLHTRNFSAEYWDNVFSLCLDEYRAGRTPNPDVLCNKEIKFKTFLEHALDLGADKIATGHYARTKFKNGYYQLLRSVDKDKDQTYFLYTLNQEQLAKSIFPIGSLHKPTIRQMAQQHGLITYDKKDSTGICFIGERKFKEFLSRFLPAQPGEILTSEGKLLGSHEGLMYYTLGQRKGLAIGGQKSSSGEPWYVVGKDLDSNTLIIAQGHDHPLLYSNKLIASHMHWIAGSAPPRPFSCSAKTRYRQPDQLCTITQIDEDLYHVDFEQPQRAVTPGQSVVFYQGEECLGGGIINRAM